MKVSDGLLHALNGGAEIRAFEPSSDGDEALKVFAKNFILWRKLLDLCDGPEAGGLAAGAVEDRAVVVREVEVLLRGTWGG